MTTINAVGIRYDNRLFAMGDTIPSSYEWRDNVCTGVALAGTCAISVGYRIDDDGLIDAPDDWLTIDQVRDIAREKNAYPYKYAYLIEGHDEGWGDDEGEIIISDARVVARLW